MAASIDCRLDFLGPQNKSPTILGSLVGPLLFLKLHETPICTGGSRYLAIRDSGPKTTINMVFKP